jgi:serine/threonine-protein kinase HipA
MAPLYDAVTTVVFPGLAHDRMAIKLNGKDSKLKKKDFLRTATVLDLKSANAEFAIEQVISDLTQAIATISLPSGLTYTPAILGVVANQLDVCRERTAVFRL